MGGDVSERLVQVLVSEGLVDNERVQRQAHDATAVFAFFVKHVELVLHHLGEIGTGQALADEQAHIIHLDRIRDRNHAPSFDVERVRLVVATPVQQIGQAELRQ